SSAFRLSTTPVSMSLAGSCFSSDSAPRPFQYGIRRRGGTIFRSALPSDQRQVQADIRTHLIHRPEGHHSTVRWSSRVLLSIVTLRCLHRKCLLLTDSVEKDREQFEVNRRLVEEARLPSLA